MVSSLWHAFSAAPHRMMMFGGTVQLLAVMTFWLVELTGRHVVGSMPLQTTVPSPFAHAFLMLYTLFPLFIFGFLMTTYPRWMNGNPVPRRHYVAAFVLFTGGIALFYLGLFTARSLVTAATALVLAGFTVATYTLWQVYRRATSHEKFYETLLNLTLIAGLGGIALYLGWLLSDHPPLLHAAVTIGLWWFLLPLAVTVCHRMIPYFSLCALPGYAMHQPRRGVLLMVGLCILHGAFELAHLPAWSWLADLPLLLLAVHYARRWDLRRSFEVRLLAMLHVAFAWFAVATALYLANSLLLLASASFSLGRIPLHAAAIGFLLSLTIAMSSRVTLGHSGRPLQADTTTWVLFWGLGGVALLRLVAELPLLPQLQLVAAGAWLVATGTWAVKYGAMYLRPRLDGKPG